MQQWKRDFKTLTRYRNHLQTLCELHRRYFTPTTASRISDEEMVRLLRAEWEENHPPPHTAAAAVTL